MAMAMHVQSPQSEYPDSDGFDEHDDDDDHQDELVSTTSFHSWTRTNWQQEAMAAMEVELRKQKKGQVIQHRHISPPLPSSSQLAGTVLRTIFDRF